MKQWYPENKIVANSIALTTKMYYVYKVTLSGTGHYYIGCTGNLSSRLSQHLNGIYESNFNDTLKRLAFHKKAYELLSDQFGDTINDPKDIKKFASIHIIGIFDRRGYAFLIESKCINENLSDPLCLNSICSFFHTKH